MSEIENCRSEDGITVGLVDAVIATCRVLAPRLAKNESAAVLRALLDLRSDQDAVGIIAPAPSISHDLKSANGELGRLRNGLWRISKDVSELATKSTRQHAEHPRAPGAHEAERRAYLKVIEMLYGLTNTGGNIVQAPAGNGAEVPQ